MKDNKLIAEFMGFTSEKNIGWYDNNMMMPQIVYDTNDGNCFDELLFDQSWDWLMPTIKECYESETEIEVGDITHGLLDCDLESTYQAVVNFIKQTTL
jgi:hypothetical protein|tara:strand:+ start:966 stop:1259 length:294 start_codon:yes stop_codon:yes gene_type:complete